MALPRVFASPQAGPIWNRPLQGVVLPQGSRLAAGLVSTPNSKNSEL